MAIERKTGRNKKSRTKGDVKFTRDPDVPDLELRTGAAGRKSWTMQARFGGAKNMTRRVVGNAHVMSAAEAREIVLAWKEMNRAGIDPGEERLQARLEEERRDRATFRRAMEDYHAWLPERRQNRTAKKDQLLLKREFLDPERVSWIDAPLHRITGVDVQELLEKIRDRPAPAEAYDSFGHLNRFFKWTLTPKRQLAYGIVQSPMSNLTLEALLLQKKTRDRKHDADEIRAYWKAAEAMPYPWGEFFQWQMLSGQRNREGRDSIWPEFDLSKRLWTIPKERFKSERDHVVALAVPMVQLLQIIQARQTANHGPFVFSTCDGWKPIAGIGKATAAFRKKMAEFYLEATGKQLKHFVIHDDRRTVRSTLSNLGVPAEVAEALIGHEKKGLEGVYNTHPFVIQKRRAQHLWVEEVKNVIDDPQRSLAAEEDEIPEWPSRWNDASKLDDDK